MNQERIMNQEVDEEITIDLIALFRAIWKKLPIVILVGVVCAFATLIGTKVLVTPKYTSVTKAYILSRQNDNAGTTISDLQMSSTLTKDYIELAKSRPVLETAVSKLNLDMSLKELANSITVDVPQDTRILQIAVENEDPETAKEIADTVREAVRDQIQEIMDVEAVNTVEEGNLPTVPSSPNMMKNTILGGLLGIIVAIGAIVLINVLDDTIKSQEEVEQYLDLNVLTLVPLKEGASKPKKARKSSRKKRK